MADSQLPKRGVSAFFLYTKERRVSLKKEKPELQNNEIIKIISEEWKALSEEKKKSYTEKAEADKKRYEAEKKAYDEENKENNA